MTANGTFRTLIFSRKRLRYHAFSAAITKLGPPEKCELGAERYEIDRPGVPRRRTKQRTARTFPKMREEPSVSGTPRGDGPGKTRSTHTFYCNPPVPKTPRGRIGESATQRLNTENRPDPNASRTNREGQKTEHKKEASANAGGAAR